MILFSIYFSILQLLIGCFLNVDPKFLPSYFYFSIVFNVLLLEFEYQFIIVQDFSRLSTEIESMLSFSISAWGFLVFINSHLQAVGQLVNVMYDRIFMISKGCTILFEQSTVDVCPLVLVQIIFFLICGWRMFYLSLGRYLHKGLLGTPILVLLNMFIIDDIIVFSTLSSNLQG